METGKGRTSACQNCRLKKVKCIRVGCKRCQDDHVNCSQDNTSGLYTDGALETNLASPTLQNPGDNLVPGLEQLSREDCKTAFFNLYVEYAMLRNTTRDHFARVFGQISRPGHLDTCQWFQNHLTNKLFSFTPNNNMLVPELYLQPNESTYPSFDDITMDPLMDATMSSAVSSTMGSTMTSTMTSSASVNWTDGNFSPGMRTDVELTMMQWVN